MNLSSDDNFVSLGMLKISPDDRMKLSREFERIVGRYFLSPVNIVLFPDATFVVSRPFGFFS